MGYYMEQIGDNFFLAKDHKDLALQAIKGLAGKETIHDSSGDHFAWVDTNCLLEATNLKEAMNEWRWLTSEDDTGNIDEICFGGEKAGDDEMLFNAIAMYVKSGSYIEMRGEGSHMWRWVFDGIVCKKVYPKISWE